MRHRIKYSNDGKRTYVVNHLHPLLSRALMDIRGWIIEYDYVEFSPKARDHLLSMLDIMHIPEIRMVYNKSNLTSIVCQLETIITERVAAKLTS